MKLIILGNGFDLHHGLETSFNNFKDYCKDKDFIEKVDGIIERNIKNYDGKKDLDWSNVEEIFHNDFIKNYDVNSLRKELEDLNNEIKKNEKQSKYTFPMTPQDLIDDINGINKTWKSILEIKEEKRQKEEDSLKIKEKKLKDQLNKRKERLDEFESFIGKFTKKFNDYITKEVMSKIKDVKINQKIKEEFNSDCYIITFNYTNTHEIYKNTNENVFYIHGSIKDGSYPVIGYYYNIDDVDDKEEVQNDYRKKYKYRIFSKEVIFYRMHKDELVSKIEKFIKPLKEVITEIVIIGHSIGKSDDYINNLLFDFAKMHQEDGDISGEEAKELDILKFKIYDYNENFETEESKLKNILEMNGKDKSVTVVGDGIEIIRKPCVDFIKENYKN